jgi:hypothetical protein
VLRRHQRLSKSNLVVMLFRSTPKERQELVPMHWDVVFTSSRRVIVLGEQQTHSFLE